MPFPQGTQAGHLGTRSAAQFALMNPASFAAQTVLVDPGTGPFAEYWSDGVSWTPTLNAAQANGFEDGNIITRAGGVRALSEVTPEVLCNPTATTTVLAVPGLYAGYRCTTAVGNITGYDSLSASGKIIVPTTALALGSFPIFGPGNPRALECTIGVTFVLSGAGVVYAGVEAA